MKKLFGFTIPLRSFEFMMNLCSIFVHEQQNSILLYFANHASSPQLPLPSLFALNIPRKKQQKQVSKKLNEIKPTGRDGTDTTILSHHPYILCHFAYYTHKTLHMLISLSTTTNEHCTLHCSCTQKPSK